MKVAIFDSHRYERDVFTQENAHFGHELTFLESRMTPHTAELARGYDAVCCFVNDHLNAQSLETLKRLGIQLIALRSAGFNNVDLQAASQLEIPVVRVPEYSPHAVAEFAVALILTLNRKIHRSFLRVRELNFALDGLVGFDLNGKTIGVVGTGKIGSVFAKIMKGFGCDVLAYDVNPDLELMKNKTVKYVDLNTLYIESDIISLHVPLNPGTRHMINADSISLMKPNVLLINTGRGALISTKDLITALKKKKIGGAGLDVYEEEEGVFFHDLSEQGIRDDLLARLLTFPNVIVTSHQAFLTEEALRNIAFTTLANISQFEKGESLANEVPYTAAATNATVLQPELELEST